MCSIYKLRQSLPSISPVIKDCNAKLRRIVRVELHLGYGKSAGLDCKIPSNQTAPTCSRRHAQRTSPGRLWLAWCYEEKKGTCGRRRVYPARHIIAPNCSRHHRAVARADLNLRAYQANTIGDILKLSKKIASSVTLLKDVGVNFSRLQWYETRRALCGKERWGSQSRGNAAPHQSLSIDKPEGWNAPSFLPQSLLPLPWWTAPKHTQQTAFRFLAVQHPSAHVTFPKPIESGIVTTYTSQPTSRQPACPRRPG